MANKNKNISTLYEIVSPDEKITFEKITESYRKDDLYELLRNAQFEKLSHMKKGELQQFMLEHQREFYEKTLHLLDSERFHILLQVAKGNSKSATSLPFDQQNWWKHRGLVFLADKGFQKEWLITEELKQVVLQYAKEEAFHHILKRNDEAIQVTKGLLKYNGVINHFDLLRNLKEMKIINIDEYNSIIEILYSSVWYYREFFATNFLFYDQDVDDPGKVYDEMNKNRDFPEKKLTKSEALLAGKVGLPKSKALIQLEKYVIKSFGISQKDLQDRVEFLLLDIQNQASLGLMIRNFCDELDIRSEEQLSMIANLLQFVNNDTPMWVNKGFSPIELRKVLELDAEDDETEFVFDNVIPFKSAKAAHENDMKVGRNDPCPCGSGKKYKKCCGK